MKLSASRWKRASSHMARGQMEGVYGCIDADTDTGNNKKHEKSGHSSPIGRLLSLTNLSTFVTV
jgi:hypothetical protein